MIALATRGPPTHLPFLAYVVAPRTIVLFVGAG